MIMNTLTAITIALNVAIADLENAKPKDSLCEMNVYLAQEILDRQTNLSGGYEIQIEEYCEL